MIGDLKNILSDDSGSSGGSSGGTGTGGGSTTDDNESYTSTIRAENAVALDSTGKQIDEITKDTPPFTVEVVFADMGLYKADVDDLKVGDVQAFYTGGSFEVGGSNRGTVRFVSNTSDYPRFRATFTNVTYTGTGKEFKFDVYYLFDDVENPVGGSCDASVFAAKPDDEDDDKKLGMAEPKIIISSYSYGNETIVAGNEFNLDFTLLNTSKELPLENITVTMTPVSNDSAEKGRVGISVTSSSNTIYIPELDAGESRSYSVGFQARPDAEVISHMVDISFKYEYIDTDLEERKKVEGLTEVIAIPVYQLDRFRVEPIADSVYAQMGEETYMTVNFVNLGKSTTSNISASLRCDNPAVSAQSEHFGNLEAGKSDSVDLYVTASEPGTFTGEVVIQYEDENSNIKELTTPFELFVEEPWYPPMQPDVEMPDMEEAPPALPTASLVLFVIGGLAIAAPIALYLIKRVKAKGSEDFDEVF